MLLHYSSSFLANQDITHFFIIYISFSSVLTKPAKNEPLNISRKIKRYWPILLKTIKIANKCLSFHISALLAFKLQSKK